MHNLMHINEALSGLPVDVKFISFDDVKNGALENVDLVINAGRGGSAWSGGEAWNDENVLSIINKWVYEGGVILGVNEPSATEGFDTYFRLEPVFGVDKDLGDRVCHGHFDNLVEKAEWIPEELDIKSKEHIYISRESTRVLLEKDGKPVITKNEFGKGCGIYMADFEVSDSTTRMLLNLILEIAKETDPKYITDNELCECAYYPGTNTIVVINNSDSVQVTKVKTEAGVLEFTIEPYDTIIKAL